MSKRKIGTVEGEIRRGGGKLYNTNRRRRLLLYALHRKTEAAHGRLQGTIRHHRSGTDIEPGEETILTSILQKWQLAKTGGRTEGKMG